MGDFAKSSGTAFFADWTTITMRFSFMFRLFCTGDSVFECFDFTLETLVRWSPKYLALCD